MKKPSKHRHIKIALACLFFLPSFLPSCNDTKPTPAPLNISPNLYRKLQAYKKLADAYIVYKDGKLYSTFTPEGKTIKAQNKLKEVSLRLYSSRENPQTYKANIAELNGLLQNSPNPPIVEDLLLDEFEIMINTQTNKTADWSQIPIQKANISYKNLCDTSITGKQLNHLTSLEGIDITRMDLEGFSPKDKNLKNANLSETKNLDSSTLHLAYSLQGANLSKTNLAEFNPIISLEGVILSGVKNLDTSLLTACPNLKNTNLSGLNLKKFNPKGKNLFGVNLSQTTDLDSQNLSQALCLEYADLSFTDLKNFKPYGLNLTGVNFSGAKNLNPLNLGLANSLEKTQYFGVSLHNFLPKGKSLKGANFTGSHNLDPKALAQAKDISGIILSGTGITKKNILQAFKKINKEIPEEVLNSITF